MGKEDFIKKHINAFIDSKGIPQPYLEGIELMLSHIYDETTSACSPELKSAAEIIKKRYPYYDENLSIKDVELDGERVQELMEEYANQFKSCSPEGAEDREPFDKFEVGVESLINGLSLENISDTPDYISAEFLRKTFELFNKAIKERTRWYKPDVEYASINQEGQDEMELWDKVIEIVLNDSSWHNKDLPKKLESQFRISKL